MPPLINAQQISKSFGLTSLFENISFTVSEGDRIGLIGPNGAGKSTLLQILEGRIKPDRGDIAVRKRTRISYVSQQSEFECGSDRKIGRGTGDAPVVRPRRRSPIDNGGNAWPRGVHGPGRGGHVTVGWMAQATRYRRRVGSVAGCPVSR